MSGPFGDGEAHLAEDRHHLVDGLADRVNAPRALRPRRQGDVDALDGQPRIELGLGQRRLARLQRRRDLALQHVERGAAGAPGLRIESGQVLHQPGDAALLAELADADALQRVEVAGRLDTRQQLGAQSLDVLHRK